MWESEDLATTNHAWRHHRAPFAGVSRVRSCSFFVRGPRSVHVPAQGYNPANHKARGKKAETHQVCITNVGLDSDCLQRAFVLRYIINIYMTQNRVYWPSRAMMTTLHRGYNQWRVKACITWARVRCYNAIKSEIKGLQVTLTVFPTEPQWFHVSAQQLITVPDRMDTGRCVGM